MRQRPFVLSPDPHAPFPPAGTAMRDPDGLLAIGGDLSLPRLLNAYRHGIFPWFSSGQPPLWWSPDPRMVFRTDGVRLSSRFRRQLKHSHWQARADTCFEQVITACAQSPRPGQHGTWITSGMRQAYIDLHRQGHAHSIEVFEGDTLAGGIYGVAIGRDGLYEPGTYTIRRKAKWPSWTPTPATPKPSKTWTPPLASCRSCLMTTGPRCAPG